MGALRTTPATVDLAQVAAERPAGLDRLVVHLVHRAVEVAVDDTSLHLSLRGREGGGASIVCCGHDSLLNFRALRKVCQLFYAISTYFATRCHLGAPKELDQNPAICYNHQRHTKDSSRGLSLPI